MDAPSLPDARAQPTIWIVEDEPPAAELAAELCSAGGAAPSVFRSALPFLRAFREAPPPRAIVLDWRLEHELSAALFMATRHRFPQLRVIYWTGSPSASLPAMVREDPWTQIVDKAGGAAAFEAAVRWALALADDEIRGGNEQWG
jgi:DNA-binding NtrC family response regulator